MDRVKNDAMILCEKISGAGKSEIKRKAERDILLKEIARRKEEKG